VPYARWFQELIAFLSTMDWEKNRERQRRKARVFMHARVRVILPHADRCRLIHRVIGGFLRFPARSLHGLLAGFFGFGTALALVADFFQLVVGEVFDPDK
jgi:hypothetical protein